MNIVSKTMTGIALAQTAFGLTGCIPTDLQAASFRSTPGYANPLATINPWVPEVEPGFAVKKGYETDGAFTPDYGSKNSKQVEDTAQLVFRALKGTKLVPGVNIRTQHKEYQKEVDKIVASLPYQPSETHIKALRLVADITVFGGTYDFKSLPVETYMKKGDVHTSNGEAALNSPVTQRIIDNGTVGDCVDGAKVFIALNELSGVKSRMYGVVARKYGQTEDLKNPHTVGHVIVVHTVDSRTPGTPAQFYTNPTWGAFESDTKATRLPNPEYNMVGAFGGEAVQQLFFWNHLFNGPMQIDQKHHKFPDMPTAREMSTMATHPKLDGIARAISAVNKEIFEGN